VGFHLGWQITVAGLCMRQRSKYMYINTHRLGTNIFIPDRACELSFKNVLREAAFEKIYHPNKKRKHSLPFRDVNHILVNIFIVLLFKTFFELH
jgi:hypothetical protein